MSYVFLEALVSPTCSPTFCDFALHLTGFFSVSATVFYVRLNTNMTPNPRVRQLCYALQTGSQNSVRSLILQVRRNTIDPLSCWLSSPGPLWSGFNFYRAIQLRRM